MRTNPGRAGFSASSLLWACQGVRDGVIAYKWCVMLFLTAC